MGTVCEFYRVRDEVIDHYIQHPDKAQEFFDTHYSWVTGKYHISGDTVFNTDKAWDIAKFLVKECDLSPDKILRELDGKAFDPKPGIDTPYYIKSDKVKNINQVLQTISEGDFLRAYDRDKLIRNKIYRADSFGMECWEYIVGHFQKMKQAFSRAEKCNDGIVVNYI